MLLLLSIQYVTYLFDKNYSNFLLKFCILLCSILPTLWDIVMPFMLQFQMLGPDEKENQLKNEMYSENEILEIALAPQNLNLL